MAMAQMKKIPIQAMLLSNATDFLPEVKSGVLPLLQGMDAKHDGCLNT